MKTFILLSTVMLSATLFAAGADNTQKVWDDNCAGCHGKDGKGDTKIGKILGAPDYSNPKVQDSFTDEQAFKDIKEGVEKDGKKKMKPFGDTLSDEQIRDLVKYIRSLKKS